MIFGNDRYTYGPRRIFAVKDPVRRGDQARFISVLGVQTRVIQVFIGRGYYFWPFVFFGPAGRGLGGVQGRAEAAGSSRGLGAVGRGARGPRLCVPVVLEAINSWKQHTVLT